MKKAGIMRIEIMDTTLRDGEQTSGVSYMPAEKLHIATLLLEGIGVDRIEVASARVSDGELEGTRKITAWASSRGRLDQIEVLGFVDGKASVDWIVTGGARVMNLLCKGSLKHCRSQLGRSMEQHAGDATETIAYARERGVSVNVYLEDWSNGIADSPGYVWDFTSAMINAGVKRIMLADTLGIMNPEKVYDRCREMITRFPGTRFDFHAHNDYDLATANVFYAVRAGVGGVHTTVNGLGERAGNVSLSSVTGILNDHLKVENGIDEARLTAVSRLVESYSGIRVPANKPIVGENVYTQTCGVHADGDSKDNLYFNALVPERFGGKRHYALGKTSGRANIAKNLEESGITLDPDELGKVTRRITELGDRKKSVTPEDLPYIISDVLGNGQADNPIRIRNYALSLSSGMRPVANIALEVYGQIYEESAIGDGQYDAFMKALWKIYDRLGKQHPSLSDYVVTIPPGGKTDALVDTVITWEYGSTVFKTRALEADQTESAIRATQKMLNIIENFRPGEAGKGTGVLTDRKIRITDSK
jgi:D-citramalate synthase